MGQLSLDQWMPFTSWGRTGSKWAVANGSVLRVALVKASPWLAVWFEGAAQDEESGQWVEVYLRGPLFG